MSGSAQPGGDDAAWVRVVTPLSPEALGAFIQDAERLLRINSMYEFQEWQEQGAGRFFMRGRNHANGRTFETALRIELREDGTRIVYESGLKTATEFRVEAPGPSEIGPNGQPLGRSVLVVTDDYSGTPEAERRAREAEVDKSLVWWGHDLHRYLHQWARWSRFAPWRWYMTRVWQPMKPTARRIAFMLIALTAFEIVVGTLAVVIFAFGWEKSIQELLSGTG